MTHEDVRMNVVQRGWSATTKQVQVTVGQDARKSRSVLDERFYPSHSDCEPFWQHIARSRELLLEDELLPPPAA